MYIKVNQLFLIHEKKLYSSRFSHDVFTCISIIFQAREIKINVEWGGGVHSEIKELQQHESIPYIISVDFAVGVDVTVSITIKLMSDTTFQYQSSP